MKKCKVFVMFIVLVITAAVFFGGCGGSDRPTRITMLVLGNRPTNDRTAVAIRAINERLIPELNVEFAIRHIEWTDWQTRYQLALASGDSSFDLVITATDWLFAWEIVRRGGFYPLTPEMLQQNAPRTWAEVVPAHWDLCTQDGYIWFIPEDQFTQFTNHGFYWRLDWAREGGLEQITTFEELETYFDIVKANQPQAFPWDVDGAAIGSVPLTGYITGKTNLQAYIGIATGNSAIFFYDVDDPYTVVSPFMEGQELIDAVRMFERWNTKGFWREDVLNYRGLTRDLMYAGLSGADQHHTMTYYSIVRPEMDQQQPGSEVQFFYFGMENNNVNRDLLTHGAMAVNAASRNPELALQVYDYLRNDQEIYMLLNYGIEGVDYYINAEGNLGRPEGWDASRMALATNFWGGRMDKFEPFNELWYAGAHDLIAHLNSFAREYPLEKFAFDNTRVSAEVAAVGDVCASHLGLMAFGKIRGTPEEAVANFRRDLQAAGYERIKDEIQRQLDIFRAEN